MLIIFDLDDTLIDTSGCITHYKLEDALLAMVRAGLAVPDFSTALQLLRRLDRSAQNAKAALAEFVDILGFDQSIKEAGIKEVYEGSFFHLPIFPLEGAVELLEHLSLNHQLALVTLGNPCHQMEKLKKAGIDFRIFSKISIVEEGSKKPYYQTIAEELGYFSKQTLVCGDRIQNDLLPARELGFTTVHILWGRGLNSAKLPGSVDYSISEIRELKDIVSNLNQLVSYPRLEGYERGKAQAGTVECAAEEQNTGFLSSDSGRDLNCARKDSYPKIKDNHL